MNKRPGSVTVIGWIFIVFGGAALLISLLPKPPEAQQRIAEYNSQHPFEIALLYAGLILALVCGIFILRGFNWARWLLVLWFGYNVVGNVLRSPGKLLFPGILFAIAVYFLFRPMANAFFRRVRSTPAKDAHVA